MDRDATTPMLQQLGTDGIGYATFEQVADQQTVRVIPLDGLTPEAPTYPFKRSLYYVYRDANNPAVQAFFRLCFIAPGATNNCPGGIRRLTPQMEANPLRI